ncbi:hypothetical protein PIB30_028170 [Stylosanthes scabra]|uniref:BRO1 domain-containing protein n=1 Tax=Stylosanthes scabra TaxID=79078 RepID=A0ABU6Z9D7_9FABA|nr:hypothetical protein [Stylosanthes scabra]
MMLHFVQPSKLKTKKLLFEDLFITRDSATLEQLKELSSRRRAIEESINNTSLVTEAIAKEMYGGKVSRIEQDIHKIEQYLPLLKNLFHHTSKNCIVARWSPSCLIQWSSALSSSHFFNLMGPRFFPLDDLQFELGMTLFLYGAFLRERALEVLSADLVQSATMFRKAAGVYHHLAHNVLPPLQYVRPSAGKPPETLPTLSIIMSLICLAEAQAVTIRKAEEKDTSSTLLSKLHHGVKLFLGEAIDHLSTVSNQGKEISPHLLEFIASCKSLHDLKGKQYLAETLKTSGEIGSAIAVLRSGLITAKKNIPRDPWKCIYQRQIDETAEVLRKYSHENDFVWRDKIPSGDQVPFIEGNKIVKFIPYNPPRWERDLAIESY